VLRMDRLHRAPGVQGGVACKTSDVPFSLILGHLIVANVKKG
jgi:hypothetical protein